MINSVLFSTLKKHYPSFKSQSKGILRRHARYQSWTAHTKNSKLTISDWIKRCPYKKEISILGAGSLLDIKLDELSQYFKKIILADASIYNLDIWGSASKSLESQLLFMFHDITGILLEWSLYITKHNFKTIDEYLHLIKTISQDLPPPYHTFYKSSATISLNILSQLPVYWQDFIFQFLETTFGARLTEQRKKDIIDAANPSSKKLIELHLEGLKPRRGSTLLISDLSYYFNVDLDTSLNITKDNSLIPKIEIKNQSSLKKQKAISVSMQDALHGFDIEKWLQKTSSQYDVKLENSWIWEIVPAGTNEDQESHLVAAYSITSR